LQEICHRAPGIPARAYPRGAARSREAIGRRFPCAFHHVTDGGRRSRGPRSRAWSGGPRRSCCPSRRARSGGLRRSSGRRGGALVVLRGRGKRRAGDRDGLAAALRSPLRPPSTDDPSGSRCHNIHHRRRSTASLSISISIASMEDETWRRRSGRGRGCRIQEDDGGTITPTHASIIGEHHARRPLDEVIEDLEPLESSVK
ncbi:unnamed protein product, partial [Urochloa humidicola]